MKHKTILYFVIAIIILGNIFSFWINLFFYKGIFEGYNYSTINQKFTYRVIPAKGRTLESMERRFENYLSEHTRSDDRILYRNFRRNPIIFWDWWSYLIHPRYKYPYLSIDDDKKGPSKIFN